MLQLYHFEIGVKVLEEGLYLGPEDDGPEAFAELLLSETAEIEKVMGLYVPPEVLGGLGGFRPYLELYWFDDPL
jgi:hypothetical protein